MYLPEHVRAAVAHAPSLHTQLTRRRSVQREGPVPLDRTACRKLRDRSSCMADGWQCTGCGTRARFR